jgi:DNA polymerase III alpha subunit (gram-positive type)
MKLFDPSLRINLNKHNFELNEFIFLDIEASGLGSGTFPIEIAYASSTGDKNEFLIKPTNDWLNHGSWCSNAEHDIHKISRDMLIENGMNVLDVANALNKSLCGKLVLCNDLEYDGVWLTQLFKAANIGVQFTLTDLRYLYEYWGEDKANAFKEVYQTL